MMSMRRSAVHRFTSGQFVEERGHLIHLAGAFGEFLFHPFNEAQTHL